MAQTAAKRHPRPMTPATDTLPLPATLTGPRLLRRRIAEFTPVTPHAIALFRLGEICNHHCPMCSNSGAPEAWQTPTPELLRRIDWMWAQGLRRVVVTGGEPTVHPGFVQVINKLAELRMAWDINTNGSRLAEPGFCATVAELGLLRAIVSLHGHEIQESMVISGITAKGHHQVVAGIDALLGNGIAVMINAVATRHTIGKLVDLLRWGVDRWGTVPVWKLVFPSTAGKGGAWPGIALQYHEVAADFSACAAAADALGVALVFENVPPCVLGDRGIRNVARSGFGETHYLDDASGDRLYSIDHIEASFNAYLESCKACAVFRSCPGVAESYLRRHGATEFQRL